MGEEERGEKRGEEEAKDPHPHPTRGGGGMLLLTPRRQFRCSPDSWHYSLLHPAAPANTFLGNHMSRAVSRPLPTLPAGAALPRPWRAAAAAPDPAGPPRRGTLLQPRRHSLQGAWKCPSPLGKGAPTKLSPRPPEHSEWSVGNRMNF